jgi:hypothetical protein
MHQSTEDPGDLRLVVILCEASPATEPRLHFTDTKNVYIS